MKVTIEASVRFSSIGGGAWLGCVVEKVVDLPLPPSIGIDWCDPQWPIDQDIKFTKITARPEDDPPICCYGHIADDAVYTTHDDAEEAYTEAGWTITDRYDRAAMDGPAWPLE